MRFSNSSTIQMYLYRFRYRYRAENNVTVTKISFTETVVGSCISFHLVSKVF